MRVGSETPRLLAGLFVVLVALAPRDASGQSADDRETARVLFEEGKQKRDSGDWRGALHAFKGADALMNVPTTKLAVARAYAALGRLTEARDAAVQVKNLPVRPNEPQPFVDARASAAELSEELAQRIPSIEMKIVGAPASPETTVTIDGAAIPREAWSAPRRVNPGKHQVVAKLGAHEVREEVELAERERKSVTLDVAPLIALLPKGTKVVAKAEPPPSGPGPLFWTGLAVAGVGLAVGSVAGLVSMSNASDAEALCVDQRCPPPAHGALDDARTWATVSTFGFVGAGVGLALAAVGWTIRPSASPPATTGRSAPGVTSVALAGTGLVGTFE